MLFRPVIHIKREHAIIKTELCPAAGRHIESVTIDVISPPQIGREKHGICRDSGFKASVVKSNRGSLIQRPSIPCVGRVTKTVPHLPTVVSKSHKIRNYIIPPRTTWDAVY